MYENFNEFIKNNEKLDIKSEREFLEVYNGKSFLNGLYRIHNLEDREKRNVPDGKKIICSVIAEEGILHLKQCQRSIREAAITVAFFLQSIHHLPENTGVHTVGKRSQKIK